MIERNLGTKAFLPVDTRLRVTPYVAQRKLRGCEAAGNREPAFRGRHAFSCKGDGRRYIMSE